MAEAANDDPKQVTPQKGWAFTGFPWFGWVGLALYVPFWLAEEPLEESLPLAPWGGRLIAFVGIASFAIAAIAHLKTVRKRDAPYRAWRERDTQ